MKSILSLTLISLFSMPAFSYTPMQTKTVECADGTAIASYEAPVGPLGYLSTFAQLVIRNQDAIAKLENAGVATSQLDASGAKEIVLTDLKNSYIADGGSSLQFRRYEMANGSKSTYVDVTLYGPESRMTVFIASESGAASKYELQGCARK